MRIIQQTNATIRQMMGYTLVSSDGRVLVIDGGHADAPDGRAVRRGKEVLGEPEVCDPSRRAADNPSELERILGKLGKTVDLWLVTHPHNDHFEVPMKLLGGDPSILTGNLHTPVVTDEWADLIGDKDEIRTWNAFCRRFGRAYPLEAGQTFDVGTIHIEVLTGSNPDILTNPVNNQSAVLRVSEGDFSMIFLGDLGVEGGRRLLEKIPPEKLRADAVQCAHHGQSAVERPVYDAVSPRFAFWPTPDWLWENRRYLGSGTPGDGPFTTPQTAAWLSEIGAENVTNFTETVVFDTKDGSVSAF